MRLFLFFLIFLILPVNVSFGSGFTADWVDIMHMNNGMYRIIIKYTNLEIGEYRETYVDFKSKKEAIDVFQKLAKGAYFYWGNVKSIYFSEKKETIKAF